MTTLGDLKTRIADDLARDDLTSQIANEITSAIDFYKATERFFWTESSDDTFDTVAAQHTYTSADSSLIPRFVKVDTMFLDDTDGERYTLDLWDASQLEAMLDDDADSARPYAYTWFGQSFRFYPVPDQAYTIRPMGWIEPLAPTSDSEPNNPWMTQAFELIRCRAKAYLFTHVVKDTEQALVMQAAERQALNAIRTATAARISTGRIYPTCF